MSETKERNYRSVKNTELISLIYEGGDKEKLKPVTEKSYLEGYFLQSTHNQGPKNNSSVHLFEVHNLEGKNLEKPTELGMWGVFVMNDQLAKVTPGTWVKVLYKGKAQPKKKGGNAYHDFEVFTDPNDMKQVTVIKEVVASSNTTAETTPERAEAAAGGGDEDLPF